ncbi:hypothetical protein [Paenibacillus alvei]|uniref:hypothetical protein n=1 Tax=Paenibacillus alvei TaxID=44250 RepID=UPI0018CEED9F|nr:hypothetical protein [Paenibacillus alvei]MBG9734960.1 hypothetical protein [Paenibacillus alvei]MBG9744835.1 hypothetical protein [Paenibacillus alvei]MCY9578718.1 hypothetical protein [Paenibacillus alvei]MCY9583776.1 hypothetical protein [Paenibacillus alvei]
MLNDTEKVTFLIHVLEHHIDRLPKEDTFTNYLESICGFLKTKDPILQKAAYSNSELFIDNISYNLKKQFTLGQVVSSLIVAFDRVGNVDSKNVSAIIHEFEVILEQMSK